MSAGSATVIRAGPRRATPGGSESSSDRLRLLSFASLPAASISPARPLPSPISSARSFHDRGVRAAPRRRGEGSEVWAAVIQFLGTLFFNVTTFFGMSDRFSSGDHANLVVWFPDAVGSVCFLAASVLAEIAVAHASSKCAARRRSPDRLDCLRHLSRRGLRHPRHKRAGQCIARHIDDAGRGAVLFLGGPDPGEAAAVAAAETAGRRDLMTRLRPTRRAETSAARCGRSCSRSRARSGPLPASSNDRGGA